MVASRSRPEGLPLGPTTWEQTPVVVQATAWQRLVHWAHAPPTAGAGQTWDAQLGHRLQQDRLRTDAAGTVARTRERELRALWTFVGEAGVKPTPNRAERALRCAVLWRKMRSKFLRLDPDLLFHDHRHRPVNRRECCRPFMGIVTPYTTRFLSKTIAGAIVCGR